MVFISAADTALKVDELLNAGQAKIGENGIPFEYISYADWRVRDLTFYLHDHPASQCGAGPGNMRVTYTAGCTDWENTPNSQRTMVLEHAADYFPYGSILREQVNTSGPEKYLTTHHERDQATGLDYRGARYYDSDVARFLSLDPLAASFVAWSPYNYVLGNPNSLVDPTGRSADNYDVDDNGNVKLTKTTTDDFDVLTHRNNDGTSESTVITDQTILPQLAGNYSQISGDGNLTCSNDHIAFSNNKLETAEAFVFLAKNTKVEWGFHGFSEAGDKDKYLLITSHNLVSASSGEQYGCDLRTKLFDIHSHLLPANGPWDSNGLGNRYYGDYHRQRIHLNTLQSQGINTLPPYAVYNSPTQELYSYDFVHYDKFISKVNNGSMLSRILPGR